MKERILVTGASGGLAAATIPLLEASYKVIGVGRRPAPGVDVTWDGSESGMRKILGEVEPVSVVHLASARPTLAGVLDILSVNAQMMQALVEAMEHTKPLPLVFASSRTVYGNGLPEPLDESRPPEPVDPYGKSKVLMESLGNQYHLQTGQPAAALRLSQIYGPGTRTSGTIELFLDTAIRGGTMEVLGDLLIKRDFLYIDDAAGAIVRAVSARRNGIFNIGSGVGVSYLELAELIAGYFNPPTKISIAGNGGTHQHIVLNIRKAHEQLGWAPSVGLSEGVWRWKISKERKNDR